MSNENNETRAEIIAEACDKYTVHDCNECNCRKCCFLNSRGFDSDECKQKRQSIALLFGIEDGYFTKLLCRLEYAHKREVEKLNSVIQAQRSAFDAEQDRQRREATAKDSLVVGNAAKLREALQNCVDDYETSGIDETTEKWHKEHFGEHQSLSAWRKAKAALAEQPRNCDLYADEAEARAAFLAEKCEHPCGNCTVRKDETALCHPCGIEWLFAIAKKGGGDEKH